MKYFFAILAVFFATPLFADKVDDYIKELGDERYIVRTAAHEALTQLGLEVYDKIEAAANDAEPERRLRAQSILQELKIKKLWLGSQVKCPTEPKWTYELIDLINEQTGNNLAKSDNYGSSNNRESITLTSGLYWQVVDELCRKSKNKVRNSYYGNHGLVLISSDTEPKNPVAYCGPIRGMLNTARRAFSEEVTYDAKTDTTHTFSISTEFIWEGKLKIVSTQNPYVLKAITDNGEEVRGNTTSSSWNTTSGNQHQFTANLQINPPSITATSFKTLAINWGVTVVTDMAILEIKPETGTYTKDDVVAEVEKNDEISVVVTRDLAMISAEEFEVEVDSGTVAGKSINDEGYKFSVRYEAGKEPTSITLSYPKIRAQKELTLVFTDVPIPHKLPR